MSEEKKLTEISALFDSCEDNCEPTGWVRFDWSAKGVGFGSFTFYIGDDGYVHCDNEIMSRQFIKDMLCKMVDNAVFEDLNSRHPDIGEGGLPPGYSPKTKPEFDIVTAPVRRRPKTP